MNISPGSHYQAKVTQKRNLSIFWSGRCFSPTNTYERLSEHHNLNPLCNAQHTLLEEANASAAVAILPLRRSIWYLSVLVHTTSITHLFHNISFQSGKRWRRVHIDEYNLLIVRSSSSFVVFATRVEKWAVKQEKRKQTAPASSLLVLGSLLLKMIDERLTHYTGGAVSTAFFPYYFCLGLVVAPAPALIVVEIFPPRGGLMSCSTQIDYSSQLKVL